MLKHVPSRNQRTKGFKLKHGFQIFLLIAFGFWLLYQFKHSHDKKEYEPSSGKTIERRQFGLETPKLGRKGFQPWIKKPEDLIDDAEESKPEKTKVRRRGGNDEINGHDPDKMEEEESEEVEDLIDEDDKEREEESEEEESEDMGKQIEDISSLKDKRHNEVEKDAKAKSEKHYEENGASRVMMRKTRSVGAEFEFGGLGSSEKTEILKQQNTIMAPSEVLVLRTESSPKVVDTVTVERGSFRNVLAKRKDDVPDFSDSGSGSSSDSLLKMKMIEPRAYRNLAWMLIEAAGSLRGTTVDENEKANDSGNWQKGYLEKSSTLIVKREKVRP